MCVCVSHRFVLVGYKTILLFILRGLGFLYTVVLVYCVYLCNVVDVHFYEALWSNMYNLYLPVCGVYVCIPMGLRVYNCNVGLYMM